MSGSYPTRPRSRSPFIVTPYVTDASGELVAEMPSCCPASTSLPQESCKLSVHHHRDRKTGPHHRLTVAQCGPHGSGFTLYPAGFAPYRRQPVLRVAPDGGPVGGGGEQGEFEETVFEAAVDAKAGRPWARITKDDLPDQWWGTQGRHLGYAARLVGIAGDLADGVREAIAAALSVSTLALRDLSRARGYRAIGRAVCDVLQRLRGGSRRALQLLVCGHLVGHWGAPWSWDATRQVMERSPFLVEGTTGGRSP